ncbi:MAG TPA: hypothetical protein VGE00_01190 [Gammaproteobacteria bacterium]
MKITPLKALLLAALLVSAGCDDAPQQGAGTAPGPDKTPAAEQTATSPAPLGEAPSQSAMAVRPAQSSAPPAAPATAVEPQAPPPQGVPSTPAAPATATTSSSLAAPSPQAKGTLLKESELKQKPFIDAPTVTKLAAQSPVTIHERNGGWFRVAAAKQEGWVRMLNVKVTEGAQSLGSGTDLTQAAALATGRAGSGNVVSTSGLRGLSEEELQSAQPDYAQFDKLNSFGVDKGTANSYAKSNGLGSRSVQYLPAPAK